MRIIAQPKPKPLSFGQREKRRLLEEFPRLSEYLKTAETGGYTFPMPPNKANGRCHWTTEHGLKELYFYQCDVLVTRGLLLQPPAVPFPCAIATAELTTKRVMDHDNAMSRLKWVCDWLVRRGYLADDKPGCLEWSGVPTQAKAKGTVQRVHITLEVSR